MIDLNLVEMDNTFNGNIGEIEEVSSKDIAIIGMAARLPKAQDIEEFWDNMRNGVDCVTEFPGSRRIDADNYLKYKNPQIDKIKYINGSYLDEIDKFDHKFFNISPKEASLMDPNQRLFLQTAILAIEDSGYGSKKLEGSETGVYLGYVSGQEYKKFITDVEPSSAIGAVPGNISAVIAGRIAYMLDLHGPAVMIDTACSSSLVAVHMACMGIRNGDCEMALAGSIKLNLLPLKADEKFGIESEDGKTRAFDEDSDGTGMGEGILAVLLKPLSKAVRDRDRIYAIIKGSAVNQDGRSIGLTAPNAAAQEKVLLKAWKDAGVHPETITYIETHGTGTKLGDPIEIDGIGRAFGKYTDKRHFCAIGALKTNIGHLDNAAGIAGMVRGVLALGKREIPPILHFNKPNKKIDFQNSPLYINKELKKWEVQYPRRCGVSAFGLSGTNCHIVLEEAPAEIKTIKSSSEVIKVLTLSARSIDVLSALIGIYSQMLKNEDGQLLEDICYTANTGRGHYEYRVALILKDKEDLKDKINKMLNKDISKITYEWLFYGENKGAKDLEHEDTHKVSIANMKLKEFASEGKNNKDLLSEVLKLYIEGAQIEWEELYSEEKRKKAKIPVYQFERTRCWLEVPLITSQIEIKTVKQNVLGTSLIENITEKQTDSSPKAVNIQNVVNCSENPDSCVSVVLKGRENGSYTITEVVTAQVWGEALGYSELNIDEDFYELGGDSIIAGTIANRMSKQMGTIIKPALIMEYTTIQEFGKYIDSTFQNSAKVKNWINIEPVEKAEYYPSSSAQKRLYVLGQLNGIETCYNMPGVMIIEGELDKERLEQGFQTLIKRHETLRTSFKTINGEIVQIVHENPSFSLEYSELKNLTAFGNLTEIENLSGFENTSELANISPLKNLSGEEEKTIRNMMQTFVRPFQLEKAPLLRVGLVKLDTKRHVMMFDMHHIISDGTSMAIMVKEIMDLYDGKVLPQLKIQYKDFSSWQNKVLSSIDLKKQEEYWLKRFEGEIPLLDMPYDYKRPTIKSFEGDRLNIFIEKELAKETIRLAEECEATLYMVLLGAYNILLSKYANQEDIVVGSPVAGRSHSDLENIIGMFVNALPMRNKVKWDQSFVDFIASVRENSLKAYENQDYQFEMLVEKLNVEIKPGRNPLYDVGFVLQNMKMPQMKVKGLSFIPYRDESKISKSDLTILATQEGDVISLVFEYCTRLFKKETIERLSKDYLKILKMVTSEKNIKIKDIELIDKDEKKKMISKIQNVGEMMEKLLDEDFGVI